MKTLTDPSVFYSRSEVLSKPSPVPAERGLYAWFFKEVPGITSMDGCIVKDNLTLLYVGISPKNDTSTQNLRKRITYHYRGDAEGSTLRQTLGVLLTKESDYPMRRVGRGKRMTFTHLGKGWLDDWMESNAFVCWVTHPSPWEIEREIIESVSLPLNIQHNKHHPFSKTLREMRQEAKRFARETSIANESNQQRQI